MRRVELLRSAVEKLPARRLRPAHKVPNSIRRILHCIEEHKFETDLTVRRILEECELRNHNVSTQFKQAVGMGIGRYLEELRLCTAQELLEASDIEIYLIAFHVGYAYVETFNRAFRRRRGVSPGVWRRHHRRT